MGELQSLDPAATQKMETASEGTVPELGEEQSRILRGGGDARSGAAEQTIEEPESELLTEHDRLQGQQHESIVLTDVKTIETGQMADVSRLQNIVRTMSAESASDLELCA